VESVHDVDKHTSFSLIDHKAALDTHTNPRLEIISPPYTCINGYLFRESNEAVAETHARLKVDHPKMAVREWRVMYGTSEKCMMFVENVKNS
jgi:hypothetical protein